MGLGQCLHPDSQMKGTADGAVMQAECVKEEEEEGEAESQGMIYVIMVLSQKNWRKGDQT